MSDKIPLQIEHDILQKMIKKKKEMGFEDKNWNEWFGELFSEVSEKNVEDTIEKVFRNSAYDKYYDDWIRNFVLNIENIWNGHSARDLIPQKDNDLASSSAIVIGRGPSIKKHNHLQSLVDSEYTGTIVCSDGALQSVLNAGVNPDKFKKFFVVTIDTQEHARNLYMDLIVQKHGKKIKCILSTTVPPTTYEEIKKTGMEVFWVHTLFDYDKGKTSFNYISNVMAKSKNHEKGFPGIQTGGNVGTSAWVIAWSILKCNPVALLGIDLGYPAEMTWEEIDKYHKLPEGIDKNSEVFKKAFPTIYNPDFNCYSKQDPKFQFYSNAFKEFIPKASKWVKTINVTEGGTLFGNGIQSMTFRRFLDEYKY